jgi:anaerobic magnesium-protoporphyrin IX monomethyl ester cyclase
MKILLIYPPTSHSIPSILPGEVEAERGAFPPLGVLYLAAALKNKGHHVEVIDAPNQDMDAEKIAKRAGDGEFDVAGISILTFHLVDALQVAEAIKRESPSCKVVAGGPHVHLFPEETLALGPFDQVFQGEAEKALPEWMEMTERQTGAVDSTGLIENLDQLDFPLRELLPIKIYHSILSGLQPTTTMMSSRGCQYACIFCDRPHLGKRFRGRSAQNVVSEMRACAELGIREVIFYDDNFTNDEDRVAEIAELVLEKELNLAWDIRARVGDLSKDTYRLCRRAGLERIHFGVESGNEHLLKVLKKGITTDQAREAFRDAREAGLETLAYFMIGIPGETEASIQESLDLAVELKPDYVHFSVMIPFPGTPVYRMALERGIIERDVWKEFAQEPRMDFQPPLWDENLERDDILKALMKVYRSFYIRPGYIMRRLRGLRTLSGLGHSLRMGWKIFSMQKP